MLFIVPLVILIAGYALALWFAATGRRMVRRFFFFPVLASLLVTVAAGARFVRYRLTPLPGQTVLAQPDGAVHFLPLYALRVAPIALGACLILNAAGYFALLAFRRRLRKPVPPAAAGG
jgi:hypothetical protein